MKQKPVLFLICSERSGSNLIRAMMDAHPQIAAPQPLHLIRDVIARADAMDFGQRDSAVANRMLDLVRTSLHKQFPADQADEIANGVEQVEPFTPRNMMRALYDGIAEQTGATLVMVKENELHEAAGQIIDAFPDARFVFQTRDPRDYLASAVALKSGRFGNKFGSFRNAMQIWSADQRFGLRMLGHFGPDRVFFQRYEDLVADPEGVLRDLCAFAGLPFAPEMLEFHQRDNVQDFSARKDAWKNLAKPVMSGNFNKYRKSLTRRQIRAVEAMLGPLMDRLGYRRDFAKETSRFSLVWPSLTEPFERRANKAWTPFFTVANSKHHAALDKQAAPIALSYAGRSTAQLEPGQQVPDLATRLTTAASQNPDGLALSIAGETWTYDRLFGAAAALAARLPGPKPVVAVYAARHASSYIGILATILAGGTYVPINCRFPDARNRDILARSGAVCILGADRFSDAIERLVEGTSVAPLYLPDAPQSDVPDGWMPARARQQDDAYILFTSGSTGIPKGVAISQSNLGAYLDNALRILQPKPQDRFSQTFDLTFDLSVHDLFVAWSSGAALCVPSAEDLAAPGAYLEREQITQWFSVPTLAATARRTGALQPGAFASLRCALFCGEALPSDVARDWMLAAPKARAENWYGPTEATIACLRHDIARDAGDGVVPIGMPFRNMTALVIGEDGTEKPDGEIGALYLGGPQVAAGYLNDPEKTAAAFVTLPGRSERFYDTGDLASRNGDVLHFHGRRDFQAKIRGYRVELGEIETVLRGQMNGAEVVALTWPPGEVTATHVVAAVQTDQSNPRLDRNAIQEQLPDYMIPSTLFGLAAFPTNASGKVDRQAIAKAIAAQIDAREAPVGDGFDSKVMAAILQIKPTLSEDEVRTADNLLMAGLDSLDFVNLTIVISEDFGVALDETRVALLANLRFDELVDNLERGVDANAALAAIPEERMVRANRAIAFLAAAPSVFSKSEPQTILAFGSSGTMRGVHSAFGEGVAKTAGLPVRVLNVGLPALTSAGLARMAEHIAGLAGNANIGAILHEFDPVLLSVVPPKGDVELDEAVFHAAPGTLHRPKSGGTELDWDSGLHGTLAARQGAPTKKKKPLWERERDHEIASVYRGETAFDAKAVDHWIAATQTLCALGSPVLGWVHPLAEGHVGGGLLEDALARCEAEADVRVVRPEQLRLGADLFLNINHMSPGPGMHALTEQLMQHAIASLTRGSGT
ncbi:amino acid adenylation domain-containing protein [Thalassococcus lentus]|uniref:Amino acid adenylation domain-containing protein n=1 Tax=Thalassococcus lentus TaxID=1210524 RepID=A0ABT4XW79_9RHOB|nr:amino acid adenylation domain-containing protein [Thalassococcus lentus]MDA7426225.1 amino acid adenylation domain-containing protein [Thalassococcus lentus]